MTTRPVTETGTPLSGDDGKIVEDPSIEYPSSDGEPMAENDWQYTALTDTVSTLRVHFQDRPDVYVAGDMLVYYQVNNNQARVAPDVYVVFGVSSNHRRHSWFVWREGKAPDFVMEIASPGTWRRDADRKRRIYAEMGVPEYWRFDPTGECFTPPLVGERLVDGEYQPIPLDTSEDGTLRGHSQVLGLDFCAFPELELRLYDPAVGQWLRTHQEEAAARQAAEAAQQRAEEARLRAEAEARALRERLRELEPGE